MEKEKKCLSCQKIITGRIDKKFCDPYCKSAYQYRKSIEESPRFFNKVENQLKLNRKILKYYNRAGKVTVRASTILNEGFNPNFFTHFYKTNKGEVYLFVFEYGFLKKVEHDTEKYVLVIWQDYMAK
jgi:hypothetical protein